MSMTMDSLAASVRRFSPRLLLSELLLKEGIQVARRTVAKYREGLGIPPSHERKPPG